MDSDEYFFNSVDGIIDTSAELKQICSIARQSRVTAEQLQLLKPSHRDGLRWLQIVF